MTCRSNCLHYNVCVWSSFREVRDVKEMKKHCGDFLDKKEWKKVIRGEWFFEGKIDGEIDEQSCSACNVHVIFGLNDPPSYCPFCGAAMIVKGDGVNANSEYE